MKGIDKICLSALALGSVGCAVFGGFMVAAGQQGQVNGMFHINLAEGSFGLNWVQDFNLADGSLFGEGNGVDYSSAVDMGDEINSLDFEVGAAKLVIKPGDSFSIQTEDAAIITCEVDGDIWELEAGGGNNGSAGEIFVTLPEDRVVNLDLEIGAGELQIGEITVKDFVVSIGAGSAKTELIDIRGMADIEVGAGSMEAKMTNPADVSIDCGLGSVTLELGASQDAYHIYADCGLGSIKAGTLRIDGLGEREYTTSNGGFDMNIDCGLGSVHVSFGD